MWVTPLVRFRLATLSGLEDDIRAMTEGVLGRVRLGSFPTASEHLMPLTIAALSTEQSGIDISLDEGEPDQLLPLLLDRELDMAVMYRYDSVPQPWPKGLRTTKLLSERLVLLLPEDHRLVGRTVELADLAEEVWIATRVGSAGATSLRRICAIAGYEPNIMFRSSDHSAVRGFVRTGLGIALVPAFGAGALDEEGIVRATPRRSKSCSIKTCSPAMDYPRTVGASNRLHCRADPRLIRGPDPRIFEAADILHLRLDGGPVWLLGIVSVFDRRLAPL
ncbi:LysR substrate-binding domain-containing protein [Rhodococcus koreensis]|uniref:LysR substrate-binding domain-containing protein n=1 Tax=Rhodococcus koreensis TaxID=99653 RepID=UPI003673416F